VRNLPGQDRGQKYRVCAVIVYRAVPYLLLAAPPAIFLLTVLLGSCTMARTSEVATDRVRFYSDPNGQAGQELAGQALASELDRRAAREELQRILKDAQR
jgi:hypothetical protein